MVRGACEFPLLSSSNDPGSCRPAMPKVKRPVCVIVRDGWGVNDNPRGNAVAAANLPNINGYKAKYPWLLLEASGESVGLPPGFQGSSEVGHLNMGAGRIVVQELKRIDDSMRDGSLWSLEQWVTFVNGWKNTSGARLHLFGLLQDEGVHAHQDHLFKIMREARRVHPKGEIVVHPFLDGRDTPPQSCLEYLAQLKLVLEEVGNARMGTMMGRYYGMDRSLSWNLTDQAYMCLVRAEGRCVEDPVKAVQESYVNEKTGDGQPMYDEYIVPHVIGDYDGIKEHDFIMHTNFRQDRAYQLTRAFVDETYPGHLENRPKITYLAFTRYYDELQNYLISPMSKGSAMQNILGEVLGREGFRQLRIAETQKFRHVTSFFNGKSTSPFPGEDQVDVPTRFDPALFAVHPEMEAYNVTTAVLKRLEDNPYDFILINFANTDMVGHTGKFDAAKKAAEIVDECVGKIVGRMMELDGHVLLTADHGNADQMIDYRTNMVKTSHTTFPVDCIYIARGGETVKLRPGTGVLGDIAPTVLDLLGVPIPVEMTCTSLLAH